MSILLLIIATAIMLKIALAIDRKFELADISTPLEEYECPNFWSGEDTVIGYMDKTDWEYELGGASSPSRVFCTVNSMEEGWHTGCGVVEVEVKFKRIIKNEDYQVD